MDEKHSNLKIIRTRSDFCNLCTSQKIDHCELDKGDMRKELIGMLLNDHCNNATK